MQPSPMAETSRPLLPSFRFCISLNSEGESAIHYKPSCSLRFKRSHVDGEPILHIGLEQSLVSFVNFLDRDHFHIRGDIIRAAKVEHLLRFTDATDGRARQTPAPHDQAKRGDA